MGEFARGRTFLTRALAVLLAASVLAVVVASHAAAGTRDCSGPLKAHNTTCNVAQRVTSKWVNLGFPRKSFRAITINWTCKYERVPVKIKPYRSSGSNGARVSGIYEIHPEASKLVG